MDRGIAGKLETVQNSLKKLRSVLVLFSGGVDSSLLLKIASEVLKDNTLAVTIDSPFIPRQEIEQAVALAETTGSDHLIVPVELEPDLATNPVWRCYYCKKKIFLLAKKIAEEKGLLYVLDGTNEQDSRLPRPGLQAAEELGVKSPLRDGKLQKEEVRILAKELGLPNWNKPSNSCLATRFLFGESLTREKLQLIEEGENFLRESGLSRFRLRYHEYHGHDGHHGQLARIHASRPDQKIIMEKNLSARIVKGLKELGFETVTLDLEEY
jgi:uncharacterized protein